MAHYRDRGNSLFAAGEYKSAAAVYTEGLHQLSQHEDPVIRSVIHSNRAACALALGDIPAAEADCRAGLALDSLSVKLHYRLAKALCQRGRYAEAAVAVACAVSLLQSKPGTEMLQLYSDIASKTHADGYCGVQLPSDPSKVGCAASVRDMTASALSAVDVVVIMPGSYMLPFPLSAGRSGRLCLVGLGNVKLQSAMAHAIRIQQGVVTLVNLQLAGDGRAAAVCADGGKVHMLDCHVQGYPGGAVLVHGGHADIGSCSFKQCGGMAVEVRQGGSVSVQDSTIKLCGQGICAYGGARHIEVVNCSIQHTAKEGILAAGTYENAATVAQHKAGIPNRLTPFRDASSQAATLEAEAWGRKQQQGLVLKVTGCNVSGCGNFGLSIDSGHMLPLLAAVWSAMTRTVCL
eukprot:GHUV01013196.1.p1 GENE.GHUV01013196.1~~GHUV01013196.1.p1  ORF type:complete len:404 (+),score=83.83 GHUV01013196.1:91-1302(+)